MKLLFDENLSSRLPLLLNELYPGSSQIELLGLRGSSDKFIWEYAKSEGYVLISKDNDFRQLSFQYGAPPKVIWLSIGNSSTSDILQLLRKSIATIQNFVELPEEALLILARRCD